MATAVAAASDVKHLPVQQPYVRTLKHWEEAAQHYSSEHKEQEEAELSNPQKTLTYSPTPLVPEFNVIVIKLVQSS